MFKSLWRCCMALQVSSFPQNWAPLGTHKSHWGRPGGHLSSQGHLLEDTFYGPTLDMKVGSPKLIQQVVFFRNARRC